MTAKYNYWIFIGRIILLLLLTSGVVSVIILFLRGERPEELFLLIFMLILLPSSLTSLLVSIYYETYDLTIADKKIRLTRPITGSGIDIAMSSIKGYSTSEVKFGVRMGTNIFKSSSIVIYTSNSRPIELIQFNYWSFAKIEAKLKELGLAYLGHEDYKTGFFFRKYSFG